MRLDLPVGLNLNQACDHAIVHGDERGGPQGAQSAVGALPILCVGLSALSRAERDAAVEMHALETL